MVSHLGKYILYFFITTFMKSQVEKFHFERGYGIIPYFPIQFLYGFFSILETGNWKLETGKEKRGIKMFS
jgi:hypothetical protein